MTPHGGPLSKHFMLDEFLPHGWDGTVPPDVLGNLVILADTLLEPLREGMGRPIRISSGWRPEAHNAEVGGVKTSDHPKGRAADVWIAAGDGESWQDATVRAFHWARVNLKGRFGQLILEDHRAHTGRDTALWLHISIPSEKHPGADDHNAVLVSPAPGQYQAFEEPRA